MPNILIPMSGRGQRFRDAGYELPKPLIDINGKPMIQRVIENIGIKGNYIFLILKEHLDKYDLQNHLQIFCGRNKCQIVEVANITEGAACTCLLAKNLINNQQELIIANSDQLVEWKPKHFLRQMTKYNADGGILTFQASEPKWSFAKVDRSTSRIIEVAEKNPISTNATAGIYWFRSGADFVSAAEQMINKNIRTNNEFYVCPVFNELIQNNKQIYNYPIKSMTGLGTPEDLLAYLNAETNQS